MGDQKGDTVMMAAKYDELVDLQTFRAGDTVRCLHNDEFLRGPLDLERLALA